MSNVNVSATGTVPFNRSVMPKTETIVNAMFAGRVANVVPDSALSELSHQLNDQLKKHPASHCKLSDFDVSTMIPDVYDDLSALSQQDLDLLEAKELFDEKKVMDVSELYRCTQTSKVFTMAHNLRGHRQKLEAIQSTYPGHIKELKPILRELDHWLGQKDSWQQRLAAINALDVKDRVFTPALSKAEKQLIQKAPTLMKLSQRIIKEYRFATKPERPIGPDGLPTHYRAPKQQRIVTPHKQPTVEQVDVFLKSLDVKGIVPNAPQEPVSVLPKVIESRIRDQGVNRSLKKGYKSLTQLCSEYNRVLEEPGKHPRIDSKSWREYVVILEALIDSLQQRLIETEPFDSDDNLTRKKISRESSSSIQWKAIIGIYQLAKARDAMNIQHPGHIGDDRLLSGDDSFLKVRPSSMKNYAIKDECIALERVINRLEQLKNCVLLANQSEGGQHTMTMGGFVL